MTYSQSVRGGREFHYVDDYFEGADGSILIADTDNHRLVRTSAPNAPAWSAYGLPGTNSPDGFVAPTGVHVGDSGRILIADPGAERLVRLDDFDGPGWMEITLPAGLRPARAYALAADAGSVLITDLVNSRVLRLAPDDSIEVIIEGYDQSRAHRSGGRRATWQ